MTERNGPTDRDISWAITDSHGYTPEQITETLQDERVAILYPPSWSYTAATYRIDDPNSPYKQLKALGCDVEPLILPKSLPSPFRAEGSESIFHPAYWKLGFVIDAAYRVRVSQDGSIGLIRPREGIPRPKILIYDNPPGQFAPYAPRSNPQNARLTPYALNLLMAAEAMSIMPALWGPYPRFASAYFKEAAELALPPLGGRVAGLAAVLGYLRDKDWDWKFDRARASHERLANIMRARVRKNQASS